METAAATPADAVAGVAVAGTERPVRRSTDRRSRPRWSTWTVGRELTREELLARQFPTEGGTLLAI